MVIAHAAVAGLLPALAVSAQVREIVALVEGPTSQQIVAVAVAVAVAASLYLSIASIGSWPFRWGRCQKGSNWEQVQEQVTYALYYCGSKKTHLFAEVS